MQVVTISTDDLEQLIDRTVSAAVSKVKPIHFSSHMTKQQVADYLGKPVSTINRWMLDGMPYKKEGNERPEFYKPQIDRWLDERFQKVSGQTDHAKR